MDKKEGAFTLLISFILITLFSKSSFLYIVNDWDDANVFFTIGKSMLDGYVPYRDLFDHKGPLVFIIHAIAAFVSYKSFFGIYLLEIVSCFAFLIMCNRIVKLYVSPKHGLLLATIICGIVYSSFAFQKGDSVEEFALPLLSFGYYFFLKYIRPIAVTKRDSIVLGLCIGIIFWMKFNILGLFVGLVPVSLAFWLTDRRYSDLFRMIIYALTGFCIVSVIPFLYFLANGALKDLYDGYFYTNLFLYGKTSGDTSIIQNLILNTKVLLYRNRLFSLFLALSVLGLRNMELRGRILSIVGAVSLFFFIFFSTGYPYYPLVLATFLPLGAMEIDKFLSFFRGGIWRGAFVGLLLAFCVLTDSNVQSLVCNQGAYLVEMKAAVEESSNGQKLTMLCYHSKDSGLMTITGLLPATRYFFLPNTNNTTEIDMEQWENICKGSPDFILSNEELPDDIQYHLCCSVNVPSTTSLISNKFFNKEGICYENRYLLYAKI